MIPASRYFIASEVQIFIIKNKKIKQKRCGGRWGSYKSI
jgi:hypothetical protein